MIESLPAGAPAWAGLLNRPPAQRSDVHIHLVGIGGSGLSAIAALLGDMGYTVSGSDQGLNEATADLARRGLSIYHGHKAEHILGAHLVLISSAVPADNPEIQAAQAQEIPVVKRSEFLGVLMAGQHGVGVAGSHGKTTTTAMIATVLLQAGLDPSFIIGSRLDLNALTGLHEPGRQPSHGGSAARAGRGPFVVEADEYDRMFLGLRLETAVVTNVEWDHVDYYTSPKSFSDAFRQFVGQLPEGGQLYLCADDPGAMALSDASGPGVTVSTYGLAEGADWQARRLTSNQLGGLDAEIWARGKRVATLSLLVPGQHNVRNALAAIAVASFLGVRPTRAAAILRHFPGAGRRFEPIGEAAGVLVIDDYAHHPTEIATTLEAARLRFPTRRIWAVFQPHTYSRIQVVLDAFAGSFENADQVLLLDIYAARERDDRGMHSRELLSRMTHPGAHYLGSIEAAAEYLLEHVAPEDVVIIMSAGNGNLVGQALLAGLAGREASAQADPPQSQAGPGVTTAGGRAVAAPYAAFLAAAAEAGIHVITGQPVARHTTFRIGGPADLSAVADRVPVLESLVELATAHGVPFTVLGGGSNVLISDRGIRGLVIANQARTVRLESEQVPAGQTPQVIAESGAAMAGLARWTIHEGWSGMEWAVSVPGTVGGAVIGNAGAHGSEIAANLAWALAFVPGQGRQLLTPADLAYTYRSSELKQRMLAGGAVPVILSAAFQLTPGDPEEMSARADEYLARRRTTQPVEPSAGSIFRNPPDSHAGQLVEAVGLKGQRIGDAQISPLHANFIVNLGHAQAADVLSLIDLARARVYEQFGVELIPEILFLGEWDRQPPYAPLE